MNARGVVLTMILIILFVVSTISIALMYLSTSQARQLEHQVRRIEAFYAAKGVMWWVIDKLRRGATAATLPSNPPGNMGRITADKITISATPGAGPEGTTKIEVTVDYTWQPF